MESARRAIPAKHGPDAAVMSAISVQKMQIPRPVYGHRYGHIYGETKMNALLAALPEEDRRRLAPHLKTRPLKLRETLHKNGDPIREVFFPGRCLVSITHTMEDGGMLEVATVGAEGLVGVGAILGDGISAGDAFIQVAGDPAQVLPIEVFREE